MAKSLKKLIEEAKADILGEPPKKGSKDYDRAIVGYNFGKVNLEARIEAFEEALQGLKGAKAPNYEIPHEIRVMVRQIYRGIDNQGHRVLLNYNGKAAKNIVSSQYRRFIGRYTDLFEKAVHADIASNKKGGEALIFAAALGAGQHRKLAKA